MDKVFKYNPMVYPVHLHIAFSDDLNEVLSGYKNFNGTPIDDDYTWGNGIAYTYYNISEYGTNIPVVLIVFKDKEKINYGNVAHEAKHAADHIFGYIREDNTIHESHAYLVEWIVSCVETTFNMK